MQKQKNSKPEKFILIIYILGYLIMSITLAVFQPLHDDSPMHISPPDEISRLKVPSYVMNHCTIPTGLEEELRIDPYGYSYGLYNAGPYLLQGLVMRGAAAFTNSDRALLISCRAVNVFFGLIMAVVVYLLGKKIFKDSRFRWLFCFGITYLPQALFLHTYINTDSCAMLSTAIILYALFSAYEEKFTVKNSLILSVGIILCALSYYNAYGYILCSIFLFISFYINKRDGKVTIDFKEMWPKALLITVVVLLGMGWWFIRAYIVLDGDFLGLKTAAMLKEQYGAEILSEQMTYKGRGVSMLTMFKENHFFACVIQSFIAAYGGTTILTYGFIYHFYRLLYVVGFVGWILFLIKFGKDIKASGKRVFFHLNMALCIIIPMVLLIKYAYTMDYQAQGRYVMPALIPIMYYVVKGFEHGEKLPMFKGRKMSTLFSVGTVAAIAVMIISCVLTVFFKALPLYMQY